MKNMYIYVYKLIFTERQKINHHHNHTNSTLYKRQLPRDSIVFVVERIVCAFIRNQVRKCLHGRLLKFRHNKYFGVCTHHIDSSIRSNRLGQIRVLFECNPCP